MRGKTGNGATPRPRSRAKFAQNARARGRARDRPSTPLPKGKECVFTLHSARARCKALAGQRRTPWPGARQAIGPRAFGGSRRAGDAGMPDGAGQAGGRKATTLAVQLTPPPALVPTLARVLPPPANGCQQIPPDHYGRRNARHPLRGVGFANVIGCSRKGRWWSGRGSNPRP